LAVALYVPTYSNAGLYRSQMDNDQWPCGLQVFNRAHSQRSADIPSRLSRPPLFRHLPDLPLPDTKSRKFSGLRIFREVIPQNPRGTLYGGHVTSLFISGWIKAQENSPKITETDADSACGSHADIATIFGWNFQCDCDRLSSFALAYVCPKLFG
jgi:hypothetical protein